VIRGRSNGKNECDLVALIGGDEYAVVTKVEQPAIIEKMIERVAVAIKLKTGFRVRVGYGIGSTIDENYHQARTQAEMLKHCRYLLE
jgi:GTP cyclohydrolase III